MVDTFFILEETTFYWEQIFERKGRVIATGHICGTLFNKGGQIPPGAMVEEAGQSIIKPNEPEIVAKLREIESFIHETQKD